MVILKCHDGLEHAEIEARSVLLPCDDIFTALAIKDVHRRVLHLGVSMTLAELRQKYWAPKGHQVVAKVIKSRQRRSNLSARLLPPATIAALPECRVESRHAFATFGVDFARPFHFSNGKRTIKVNTLFICATTRAVHIEPVTDM